MRALILTALCTLGPTLALAQDTAIVIEPESSAVLAYPPELPRAVAEEAIRQYNAPTTTRLVGRSRLPAGNTWTGDVAVRNGAVSIGGRVVGSVVVINGGAILDSTAVITGDLTVIGGGIARAPGSAVGGTVRVWAQPLAYRVSGEELELAHADPRRWLKSLGVERSWGTADSRSALTLATAGTYNRVEGLPIVFGPTLDWKLHRNLRFRLDALGVFRTSGDLSNTTSNLGYLLKTELRSGEVPAYGLEFRAYDVIAPVEDWGLGAAEVGWAAFLFQRDYRDYYVNQGLAGRAFIKPERALEVALELRRDRQASVIAQDPVSVFHNAADWRRNPPIDAGHYTTLSGVIGLDTRNDRRNPTAGWLVRAEYDHSHSADVSPATGVPTAVRGPIPTDGTYAFSRVFFDLRRYTRVSPSGRVNLRLLAGGWLGGDPLPLQERLSIGGPDPLPGYGFRHTACSGDIIDPQFTRTLAAACDRIILTQVEYRGHIALHWAYGSSRPEDEEAKSLFNLRGLDLVVLGDAGQAWLVGTGPGRVPSDRLPDFDSMLADLGLGIDWGGLGLYISKAVTAGERLRFTVRLDHRF